MAAFLSMYYKLSYKYSYKTQINKSFYGLVDKIYV